LSNSGTGIYRHVGPVDILNSGLAPGMIGTYQLDVRLPDQLPAGSFVQVACRVDIYEVAAQVPVRP